MIYDGGRDFEIRKLHADCRAAHCVPLYEHIPICKVRHDKPKLNKPIKKHTLSRQTQSNQDKKWLIWKRGESETIQHIGVCDDSRRLKKR